MDTVTKIEGLVWHSAHPDNSRIDFYPERFRRISDGNTPALLLISSGKTAPKVFTQEQLDAAVRLTLIRVANTNEAGRAIAKIIAKEHGLEL